MGRFVYMPVPSENEEQSKHGQVIADIYSGHISTNHNNVIVSATKRIENKLEDVFQIESNIAEQRNVIVNLNDDYYLLINSQLLQMLKDFDEIKMKSILAEGKIRHLRRGIGIKENEEEPSILDELKDSIHTMLDNYKFIVNDNNKDIIEIKNFVDTSDDNSKFFTLDKNGKEIKLNLTEYIDFIVTETADQKAEIATLKNNLLSKI